MLGCHAISPILPQLPRLLLQQRSQLLVRSTFPRSPLHRRPYSSDFHIRPSRSLTSLTRSCAPRRAVRSVVVRHKITKTVHTFVRKTVTLTSTTTQTAAVVNRKARRDVLAVAPESVHVDVASSSEPSDDEITLEKRDQDEIEAADESSEIQEVEESRSSPIEARAIARNLCPACPPESGIGGRHGGGQPCCLGWFCLFRGA